MPGPAEAVYRQPEKRREREQSALHVEYSIPHHVVYRALMSARGPISISNRPSMRKNITKNCGAPAPGGSGNAVGMLAANGLTERLPTGGGPAQAARHLIECSIPKAASRAPPAHRGRSAPHRSDAVSELALLREDGTFSRSDFRFDRERNVYVCPADKLLKTTGNVGSAHKVRCRALKRECRAFPLKPP